MVRLSSTVRTRGSILGLRAEKRAGIGDVQRVPAWVRQVHEPDLPSVGMPGSICSQQHLQALPAEADDLGRVELEILTAVGQEQGFQRGRRGNVQAGGQLY